MIERLKRKLKKTDNHGSSFVLVIVATTFMCVLASALLMGSMMTYKLKYYKLNSLNNFYEVETALDEMYAGLGAATNEHLYSAYTTTAELVVVYDTKSKSYTTLDNDEANKMFKKLFMTGFASDVNYKSISDLKETLQSFISNEYDAANNPYGVRLDTTNTQLVYTDASGYSLTQYFDKNGKQRTKRESGYDSGSIQTITFKNISVKRTVLVSGTTGGTTAGTYEQSITTDIVLTEPEYNVSFDISSSSTDALYDYAILADMGVEIGDANATSGTDVIIKGNVYAASDYYNKDYNNSEDTKVTTKYETAPTTKWGTTDSSMYSGIFVTGMSNKAGEKSSLTLNSDVVVCSGSLTAYNGSSITLSGRTQTLGELWTDGIVIGGTKGGSMKVSANAYVFDDTELNAESSSLKFTQGRYFGYSFNAKDTRSIDFLRGKGYMATGYKLRSHFSDSAIIVNGKDSTLDLQELDSLYIAGKSYIEFSKVAASTVSEDDKTITVDDNAQYAYTSLTDYSTGQSLDVKTNQLIFLTQWQVKEDPTEENPMATLYFPKTFAADDKILDLYKGFLTDIGSGNYVVKAIKQSVSGHDYYYLYIEDDDKNSSGVSKAEQFAEKYYDLLANYSDQVSGKLYNVTKYESFDVDLVLPDTSKINASQAVTAQNKDADDVLFYRASTDATMDVDAALTSAATSKIFANMLGNNGTEANKTVMDGLKTQASKLSGYGTASAEEKTSDFLSYMYINLKDHLSVLDKQDETTKLDISAWTLADYKQDATGYVASYDEKTDSYDFDYSITPLTNYVDFSYILKNRTSVTKMIGDSVILISNGDISVSATDGTLEGIIIAAGDVRFDETVKSFRGMIITGSKLILKNDVTISSDAAFVANLLEQCSESTDSDISQLTKKDGILKNYVASKKDDSSSVSGVSISDITYGDILGFRNWKKNVD